MRLDRDDNAASARLEGPTLEVDLSYADLGLTPGAAIRVLCEERFASGEAAWLPEAWVAVR